MKRLTESVESLDLRVMEFNLAGCAFAHDEGVRHVVRLAELDHVALHAGFSAGRLDASAGPVMPGDSVMSAPSSMSMVPVNLVIAVELIRKPKPRFLKVPLTRESDENAFVSVTPSCDAARNRALRGSAASQLM